MGWKRGEGGRFVGEEAVAGQGGPSLSPAPALGRGKRAEGGGRVGGGLVEKGRKKSGI